MLNNFKTGKTNIHKSRAFIAVIAAIILVIIILLLLTYFSSAGKMHNRGVYVLNRGSIEITL